MYLGRLLVGAAPFALVLLVHYVRFAAVTLHGTGARHVRLRHSEPVVAAAQEPSAPLHHNSVAAAAHAQPSEPPASADEAAAVAEAAKRRAKCQSYSSSVHALSSSDATGKMLACAGLLPEPGVGLSEVLTADRIHALLPPGAVVYLTFCNYAYLHFAQNWWSQVHMHHMYNMCMLHAHVVQCVHVHVQCMCTHSTRAHHYQL